MSNSEFYTAHELIDMYPHVKRWGWTVKQLGVFYRNSLLSGFISGKEKRVMICLDSFHKLLEHVNTLKEDNKIDF